MKSYKALISALALASLLSASAASAQTATTTANGGISGPDLAVSIVGSGIMLDATHSSVPIQVNGLPFSIGGAIGGTCQLNNSGTALGTIGTGNMVTFNSAVIVPAGSSVTLPVTCAGAVAGSYPVTLVTSVIPAIVQGSNESITPRGIGGSSNNDTTAVGTLTIGSNGTVTGITTPPPSTGTTGTTGTTGGTGSGAVLGTSTSVPNIPNTGAGGEAAATLAVLLAAGAAALIGGTLMRRKAA